MKKEIIDLKQTLKAKGISGLALDIDDTLTYTVQDWMGMMQKEFGNPENLSASELKKKYRYVQDVPYWQGENVTRWIMEKIEDDEFQPKLNLIENTHKIVNEIHEIRPFVSYITNRPESVRGGTLAWLKKHSFPSLPLIMRPNEVHAYEGGAWKASTLEFLYPQVSGIVDDNPSLLEKLSSDYKGTIYLYDTVEAIEGGLNVVPCKGWDDVKIAVLSGGR